MFLIIALVGFSALTTTFDFLVFSKADIDEKRKLSSLSEFSEVGDICELKDIFYINFIFSREHLFRSRNAGRFSCDRMGYKNST